MDQADLGGPVQDGLRRVVPDVPGVQLLEAADVPAPTVGPRDVLPCGASRRREEPAMTQARDAQLPGGRAETPTQIPPRGWWQVLKRGF